MPDEGRTCDFDVLYNQFGIYAPGGQQYTPVEAGLPLYYRESETGRVLQEGITESDGLAEFTAAATAGHTWNAAVIPFFTYYSMFGFQRVGDLIWALADARGRGFLVGATAGRTTLSGEGLQHTDGSTHLSALAAPSCRAYDPAFAYETATIVRHGVQTMCRDGDESFHYLTVYNEDAIQQGKPAESGIDRVSVDEAIVRGPLPGDVRAGGPNARGPAAGIGSRPADPARSSHLEQALGVQPLPVVAVSDYVSSPPDAIARFVPESGFVSLGTDDFGLSDSREELRSHFGTDAEGIRGGRGRPAERRTPGAARPSAPAPGRPSATRLARRHRVTLEERDRNASRRGRCNRAGAALDPVPSVSRTGAPPTAGDRYESLPRGNAAGRSVVAWA